MGTAKTPDARVRAVTCRALRHRVRCVKALRDAGITIAFPQRDVHLDSLRPVEVRVVADAPPEKRPADKKGS